MKFDIHTVHNRGFRWFHRTGIYFKGFIRCGGIKYTGEDAIDFFAGFPDVESVLELMPQVDGMYSVLIRFPEQLLVIADRMRTFPLFYYQQENNLTVTDDPYIFKASQPIGEVNAREFLLTGFTTGRNTLLEEVYQIPPCEVLLMGEGKVTGWTYYSHLDPDVYIDSFEVLSRRFRNLLFEVFEEFTQSLNGRPVALSLSGGYDSRLIAYMLQWFGCKNVLCFTYGRAGNEELALSRKTAEQLGFEWVFVEYHTGMAEGYLDSVEFQDYVRFSAKLSSMPFLIDYFAVQYLRDHHLVPDDAVFLTGHSGDSIAGSHLKGKFKPGDPASRAARVIYQSAYNLSRIPGREDFYDRLIHEMESKSGPAYALYEDWILRERQAKFIVNSANVYDYFGYEYRLPLWDVRLLQFFRKVPIEFKNYKYLYDHVLRTLFAKANLDFENELQPSIREIQFQKIKEWVKDFLPARLVRRLQKQHPWHAYDLLTAPMQSAIRHTEYEKQCGPEYNSVICNWYLATCLDHADNSPGKPAPTLSKK